MEHEGVGVNYQILFQCLLSLGLVLVVVLRGPLVGEEVVSYGQALVV